MKSDKLIFVEDIRIEKIGGKLWPAVYFDNGTRWIPVLIEQALIAQKVAQCVGLRKKILIGAYGGIRKMVSQKAKGR